MSVLDLGARRQNAGLLQQRAGGGRAYLVTPLTGPRCFDFLSIALAFSKENRVAATAGRLSLA